MRILAFAVFAAWISIGSARADEDVEVRVTAISWLTTSSVPMTPAQLDDSLDRGDWALELRIRGADAAAFAGRWAIPDASHQEAHEPR